MWYHHHCMQEKRCVMHNVVTMHRGFIHALLFKTAVCGSLVQPYYRLILATETNIKIFIDIQ